MCRIFGIKHFDYTKHKELVENFFKLAEIGKTLKGDRPGHTDGWGIGYYKNGEAVIHKSGGSVIKEKNDFFSTLEKIAYSKVLIVHFRKSAWLGTNGAENSHPFRYKNILEHPDFHWDAGLGSVRGEESASPRGVTVPIKSGRQRQAGRRKGAHALLAAKLCVNPYGSIPEGDILFAHNGTIYDYKNLLKNIKPKNNSHFNSLDSEVFFLYIMNFISSGLENAFKKSVSQIIKNNKHSSLTCIFTDGHTLYAYREYSKSPDYYTLYSAKLGNSGIISSEPVSQKLKWEILRKEKLFRMNL